MLDIDEYEVQTLRNEISSREYLQREGKCDYCYRTPDTKSCKFPHRHNYNGVIRPEVVTLCGSTKFKDEFITANRELTLQRIIVISVGLFGWDEGRPEEVFGEDTKKMLDEIHKRKIDLADRIHVINVGGYIGSSTRSEIEYAEKTGKKITYLVD